MGLEALQGMGMGGGGGAGRRGIMLCRHAMAQYVEYATTALYYYHRPMLWNRNAAFSRSQYAVSSSMCLQVPFS
jgi:hypothetical protein